MTFIKPVLSEVEGKDEVSAAADRMTFYEAVKIELTFYAMSNIFFIFRQ